MKIDLDIPEDVLTEVLAASVCNGKFSEQIVAQLANLYSEVITYNRTDAAKLLNIARSTLYQYENTGIITFRSDGRITLAALVDFQRHFKPKTNVETIRRPYSGKRRNIKSFSKGKN